MNKSLRHSTQKNKIVYIWNVNSYEVRTVSKCKKIVVQMTKKINNQEETDKIQMDSKKKEWRT